MVRASCSRLICEDFCEGGGELLFGPEIMFGGGGVGLGVALVVFDGVGEMFCGGFAERGGLVEKDDWAKRAFGEFEERGLAGFGARAEVGGIFPGGFFVAAWLDRAVGRTTR